MTTFFISRHPGALEWAKRQGLKIDRYVVHLDSAEVSPGDIVTGSLPVHLVADICARGARYLHLVLDLPDHARGRELSADDLEQFGARLEPLVAGRELRPSEVGRLAEAVDHGQVRE
jgi:CRISPR-associated protein Csx16